MLSQVQQSQTRLVSETRPESNIFKSFRTTLLILSKHAGKRSKLIVRDNERGKEKNKDIPGKKKKKKDDHPWIHLESYLITSLINCTCCCLISRDGWYIWPFNWPACWLCICFAVHNETVWLEREAGKKTQHHVNSIIKQIWSVAYSRVCNNGHRNTKKYRKSVTKINIHLELDPDWSQLRPVNCYLASTPIIYRWNYEDL